MFKKIFKNLGDSPGMMPNELLVLKFLLRGRSSDCLMKQASSAPEIERTIKGGRYAARITYLNDQSLLFDNDVDLDSPKIKGVDQNSNKELVFSTKILRGGFLFGLVGQTADGSSWPSKWFVDSFKVIGNSELELTYWLDAVSSPLNPEKIRSRAMEILDWAGGDASKLSKEAVGQIELSEPATTADLNDCEKRLQIVLPTQYGEFVALSNGLSIRRGGRPYEILGLKDLDFLDEEGRWLCVTPLYENGWVVLDIPSESCFLLSPNSEPEPVGEFKDHVRESLEWEIEDA